MALEVYTVVDVVVGLDKRHTLAGATAVFLFDFRAFEEDARYDVFGEDGVGNIADALVGIATPVTNY